MNPSIHLSDEVLGQLVSEQTVSTDPQQAETHLSHCVACQQRLLSLAAEPEWRNEAAENLQSSSDWICGSTSNIQTNRFQAGFTKDKPYGDAFDLSTVDAMLQEILGPPSHPEMMGRLGRYEIESVLGCGGMGVVLRGHDHDLQRPVAIKLILPRLAKNGTAKQRFAREARAAAAVLHPNVISIHGIDETGGVPWFVMPLVAGPCLKELVDEKGPLPEREIVQIGMQIASGLAAAHSQGLVHRDIKPENILVDNNVNRVVITDFGLARRDSEESMTQTGVVAGTLNYMSPEQAQGKAVDSRCDLFSLGSLLFFLAAGEVPFQAEVPIGVVHKIVQDQHPDVRTLNPSISPTLAAVIDRLLAKEPQDRFASASELEDVFMQYVNFLNQPASAKAPDIRDIQCVPRSTTNRISERTFLRAVAMLATCTTLVLIGAYVATRLFAPTPVPPEKLWQSIQAEYQLASPDAFSSEFDELILRYESFSSQLASDEGLFRETDEFTAQLESLRSQIDQVGQQLDRP